MDDTKLIPNSEPDFESVMYESVATFDVTFKKRLGLNSYSDLHTLSLSSERKKLEILVTPVSLTLGDELACAITSGICVDVKAGLLISGS